MSDAKVAANRENAKKSTGPRTDEGKRRSAMNAVRHGFCAKTVCVYGERSADFNALMTEFVREHCPVSGTEYALVYRMTVASWNMRRVAEAETSLIDGSTLKHDFENGVRVEKRLPIGEAMLKAMKDDKRFGAMQVYQQRHERAFYRALAELRQLRKDRADRPADDEEKEASSVAFADPSASEPTEPPATDLTAPGVMPPGKPDATPQPRTVEATPSTSADTTIPTTTTQSKPAVEAIQSSEQTNPRTFSQPIASKRLAPTGVGSSEPKPASPPARPVSLMDKVSSNMRRRRSGLPILYPEVFFNSV